LTELTFHVARRMATACHEYHGRIRALSQPPQRGERTTEMEYRLGSAVIAIWLIIGAIAAGQRHYYNRPVSNCNKAGTIIRHDPGRAAELRRPEPKISCKTPQPSK